MVGRDHFPSGDIVESLSLSPNQNLSGLKAFLQLCRDYGYQAVEIFNLYTVLIRALPHPVTRPFWYPY